MNLQGFVDLQVNGYRGIDFSDMTLTADEAVVALRGLVADGTAILLPTVITASEETYARNLPLMASILARPEFAACAPGLHLEGPFLSPREGAAGAHMPKHMRPADPRILDRLQTLADGRIRLITIAPELPGAAEFIRHARARGISVSLGHHAGDARDIDAACNAGATMLTHLGNGMPQQVDRHANALIDGMAEERLTACVIGDGHHLPWNLVKVILRAKGIGRCALVSDASSLAGLPPGTYPCFGATAVISADGRIANPDTGYLMGSSQTIRQVVNATRSALQLTDAEIHRLAIINPLRMIGAPVTSDLPYLPRAADGSWLPA